MPVVVLISGNGSNLQALIDSSHSDDCPYFIAAVASNQANAYGLLRAERAGIPRHCISHRDYADRDAFDQAMIECIDAYQPGLIVLAGFMRILTTGFVQHYQGRMLNIHPSLLPKYRGLHTHQRAQDAGDKIHGLSIHFVTEELDDGPIVLQATVPVYPDDTVDTLSKRVQLAEHIYYPQVVCWYAECRLSLYNNTVIFDQNPLDAPIIYQQG